jgi:hypothetical protein
VRSHTLDVTSLNAGCLVLSDTGTEFLKAESPNEASSKREVTGGPHPGGRGGAHAEARTQLSSARARKGGGGGERNVRVRGKPCPPGVGGAAVRGRAGRVDALRVLRRGAPRGRRKVGGVRWPRWAAAAAAVAADCAGLALGRHGQSVRP